MYDCFWNVKTHKWDVQHYDSNTIANQLMFRFGLYGNKEESIGFTCKDTLVNKYVDKMKNNAIKEKQKEIAKLQKEIENIRMVDYPVI